MQCPPWGATAPEEPFATTEPVPFSNSQPARTCLFARRRVLLGKNALRGCEVNGPACGGDYATIFRQGELVKMVEMSEAAPKLLEEIQCFTSNS